MNKNEINNRQKLYSVLSITFIVAGVIFLIPYIVFNVTNIFLYLTFPTGMIALVFGILSKKSILIIFSALVVGSLYILIFIAYIFEAISGPYADREVLTFYAPEYTIPVAMEGEIDTIIESSYESEIYLYFGRKDCDYCITFEETFETILREDENFRLIYYYNTTEMPRKEATEVLEKYNIDRVPYLIKLDQGDVVKSVTIADEALLVDFFN
ncbi:MAG: hypothetical protein ACK5ML_08040 [Lachnospiraceae bacterium]